MITLEVSVEIRVLVRQGKGVRQIARELNVSRNTVRRYLRTGAKQAAKPRAGRIHKLDAFKDFLCQLECAAHPLWLPATALLPELRAQGYVGTLTQLRVFLQSLRPRVPAEPLVRFETAPGQQMQVAESLFVVVRHPCRPLWPSWAIAEPVTLNSSPMKSLRR